MFEIGNILPLRCVSSRKTQNSLFSRSTTPDRVEAETVTLAVLEKHSIDWVVLARFLKILSPNFVWRYKNKIVNNV